MTIHNRYESPLSSRYASKEMSYIFSAQFKHSTWRKLWIELAKGESSLGLPITKEQIDSLEKHKDTIDFEKVTAYEKIYRHDVMAHVHAYGEDCPEAKGVIHLGATSCYVTDNTDILQMREGLKLLQGKLFRALHNLTEFAERYRELPCLSFTHLQPAQPTTVGKRGCMWIQDLLFDFKDISSRIEDLPFLGVKGATGTQASFLSLFEGDGGKVDALESYIASALGFNTTLPISGQTYTRKIDMRVFSALSGIGATASKIATDLRILTHLKELEEAHTESQIGSSAMPYKRNPIHAERICGLARFLFSLSENPTYTAATQWLERSLDDSANRRLSIAEGFLTTDGILNLLVDITSKLTVYPQQVGKNLQQELPFLATENILMQAVKKGGDRQVIHEKLRVLALKAKEESTPEKLIGWIATTPSIGLSEEEVNEILNIKEFIGKAPSQVTNFLKKEVLPLLKEYSSLGDLLISPIEI